MRLPKILKLGIFGCAISQLTLLGIGGLAGSYTRPESNALDEEFQRKPLSDKTLELFHKVIIACSNNAWLEAFDILVSMETSYTADGATINLHNESYVVNGLLYEVLEKLGENELAAEALTQHDTLLAANT